MVGRYLYVDSGNPKGGDECALWQGQAFEEERLCRLETCASDGDAASPDRPVAGFGHPHIDGEAAPLEPGCGTESVDRIGVDLLEQNDVRNGTKGGQPFSLQYCRRPDAVGDVPADHPKLSVRRLRQHGS